MLLLAWHGRLRSSSRRQMPNAIWPVDNSGALVTIYTTQHGEPYIQPAGSRGWFRFVLRREPLSDRHGPGATGDDPSGVGKWLVNRPTRRAFVRSSSGKRKPCRSIRVLRLAKPNGEPVTGITHLPVTYESPSPTSMQSPAERSGWVRPGSSCRGLSGTFFISEEYMPSVAMVLPSGTSSCVLPRNSGPCGREDRTSGSCPIHRRSGSRTRLESVAGA